MKLQRSTLALVATALLLGGVVLFTEARQANRSATVQGEGKPIYEFEEANVVGLHVETQTQEVTFERDDLGAWQLTNPENYPAEEAAIAFLLSRLTTDGLLNTTTIDAANQAEFGLDVPFATVEITLEDGTLHTLVLGDADFSGQNSYAFVDPEAIPLAQETGEVEVFLVSQDIVSGVDRPLDEWKAVVEIPAPDAEPEAADAEADDNDAASEADAEAATEDVGEETAEEGEEDTDPPATTVDTEATPETDSEAPATDPEADTDTEAPEANTNPSEGDTADSETAEPIEAIAPEPENTDALE
ncbi:MAG: DUF4340 domain-containing protein [Cyanobacteria bacterium J06639_14]